MFGVGGVDPNPGSHKLVGIDPSKESDKIYSQVADDTSSDVQVQRGSARSRSNSKVDSELSAEEKAEVSSLKYHLTSITNAHGIVAKRDFLKLIESLGIGRTDPRMRQMFDAVENLPEKVNLHELITAVRLGGLTIRQALSKNMIIPEFAEFREECRDIFDRVANNSAGEVADYIPQLGKVPASKFAVSVMTVDGQQFNFGDWEEFFCLQSVSKPVTYACAVEEHGLDYVHQHVGREPSGRAFNDMALKQLPEDRPNPMRRQIPHNPLINAGAIMCTSLIQSEKPLPDQIGYYLDKWSALCAQKVEFDPMVMMSERSTADRNQCLTYMMREEGAFEPDVDIDKVLEMYFSACAVTLNAKMCACAAATLAHGGVNPLTDDEIFAPDVSRSMLALMLSCGMYDYSGEWAFSVGLPAKSGVSGALMVVVPNVLGMCIWSPPLDSSGNSVRGVDFTLELVRRFAFHHLAVCTNKGLTGKRSPIRIADSSPMEDLVMLLYAAASGNIKEMQSMMTRGVDVNAVDYDGRSALHLASSEGQLAAVKFLLAQGACAHIKDRFGNAPSDDSKRYGFHDITMLLKTQSEDDD